MTPGFEEKWATVKTMIGGLHLNQIRRSKDKFLHMGSRKEARKVMKQHSSKKMLEGFVKNQIAANRNSGRNLLGPTSKTAPETPEESPSMPNFFRHESSRSSPDKYKLSPPQLVSKRSMMNLSSKRHLN